MSDNERNPRSLRKRIGDLVESTQTIKVRGEDREVTRPGNGSLGSAISSLTSVKDNSGGLGDQAALDQAIKSVHLFYASVANILDEVPEGNYERRKLAVEDMVLPSKNATEKMKERFGPSARKVLEIMEDDGLVRIEGYGVLPRTSVVEVSIAEMIAKRKPRGSAEDSNEENDTQE